MNDDSYERNILKVDSNNEAVLSKSGLRSLDFSVVNLSQVRSVNGGGKEKLEFIAYYGERGMGGYEKKHNSLRKNSPISYDTDDSFQKISEIPV